MTVGPTPFPSSRTYALLVLGVVALTIYGSLVPFESQSRSFSDAVEAFEWVLQNRTHLESRSDGAANFLLGLPLGFCLLGTVRLDRRGRAKDIDIAFAIAILPLCIAFASAVEFSQLWFPKRTCSTTDIEAQSLGSTTGLIAWILCGQKLTNWLRGIWATDRYGGKVGRVILLYLFVLLVIQVLPFDVLTSPSEVFKRMGDEKEITVKPFAEWREIAAENKRVEKVVSWLHLVGVFLPVGILVSRLPGFWRTWAGLPVVFCSAVILGFLMEVAQVPVVSRHASVTDVIIEAGSVLLGWIGALACRSKAGPFVSFGFAVAWTAFLVATGWYPFDFNASVSDRVDASNLIPFIAIETTQYLMLLNEVLEVVVIYAPLGAVAVGFLNARSMWPGVALAAAVACGIEVGQIWLASRIPATTDILLASFGGGVGANVWLRLRKSFHSPRDERYM